MTVGQWALWFLAMSAVMGLIGRARRKARQPAEWATMRPPFSILVVGVVCMLCGAGTAVVSNLYPNDTVTWWTTAGFLALGALGLPLIAGYFLERHRLSDEGIDYRSFFGRRRRFTWAEISEVRFAPSMRWFRLKTQSGATARISVMLLGLPGFAQRILRYAPDHAFDPQTRGMLSQMARGDLPPVW